MKRLDPKSPEFKELVRNTISIKLDLPPLKIPVEKTEGQSVINTNPSAKSPKSPKATKLSPLKKEPQNKLPPLATAIKNLPKMEAPKVERKLSPKVQRKTSPKVQKKLSPKLQKKASPPRPVEFVDAFAATVELTDLLGMIREAFDREVRMFGERGMLHEPLRQLANGIVREKNMYERSAEREEQTKIPIDVYLEMLNYWKREIKYLIDKQNGLGRRCKNAEDPISFTSIDSLDNSHYIRLDSGECWEVDSLLDYIQNYTRGQNDASKLKNYSSPKIWQDQTELNRILKHPLAIKSGFSAWFNNLKHADAVNKISEQTLRLMAWAASLLSSRGDDFRAALDKELDSKQKEEMKKAGGNIYNIRNKKVVDEIQFTVATTLKSMAVAEFFKYFNSLSKDEKDAILTFDPSFEKNVVLCNKGEFCVFGMADQLLATRNTIAQLKKLPIINFGSRFD